MNGTPKKQTLRKRGPMPSKRAILEHWTALMWDAPKDTKMCWGCGFEGRIERAHLNASCYGGDESLDNLVLLCKPCHLMQEVICTTIEGERNFREAILDEAPFIGVALTRLEAIHRIMKG